MSRQRIDLRRFRYGLGYLLALAVALLVVLLAHRASAGRDAPAWWMDYAVPAIYWSSPFLVALVILLRLRRRQRLRAEDEKAGESDTTGDH